MINGALMLENMVADSASEYVLLIFGEKHRELIHCCALRADTFGVLEEHSEQPFGKIWVEFLPQAFEK